MGLFSRLFKGERAKGPPLGAQPRKGWPWTLSVDGTPASDVTWDAVARALDGLGPHDDRFVILEQRQGRDYWYIQSAVGLAGPHTGEFVVGVGWNGPDGKHYIDRCGGAREAEELFRAAWAGEPLDFTGFEDQSDMLPGEP